jgi:hypothetical protein
MDDGHYGWVINTHYDWLNMLIKMEKYKPKRFKEFQYSKSTIYYHLDRLNQEQHIYD